MKESYPSQSQDKFVLRLPDGMRDRIRSAAEANNRSMNSEIVATLEDRYPAPPTVIPMDRVTEILNYVDQASSREDLDIKINQANEELAKIGLMLKWSAPRPEDGLDYGRTLFVTKLDTKRSVSTGITIGGGKVDLDGGEKPKDEG